MSKKSEALWGLAGLIFVLIFHSFGSILHYPEPDDITWLFWGLILVVLFLIFATVLILVSRRK